MTWLFLLYDLTQVQGFRDAPDEPRHASPSGNYSKRPRMEDLS